MLKKAGNLSLIQILMSVLSYIHCKLHHIQNPTFSPVYTAGRTGIRTNGQTGQTGQTDQTTSRSRASFFTMILSGGPEKVRTAVIFRGNSWILSSLAGNLVSSFPLGSLTYISGPDDCNYG